MSYKLQLNKYNKYL